MRNLSVLPVVLAGFLLLASDPKGAISSHAGLGEFETNVRRYMDLRKAATKSVPDLDKKEDPAALIAHERAVAAAIRRARPNARAGDIITPAARKYFQSLTLGRVSAPGGAAVKDTLRQGNPPTEKEGANVQLKINGAYPKAAPKSTMPPSLLARFPKLPDELEYRFIGRTLILLDRAANIIIDYAPQVGPSL